LPVLLDEVVKQEDMNQIRLKDKNFKLFIPEKEIQAAVVRMAALIRADWEGEAPLVVGILNGAFMFTAALMREMNLPFELTFARYASYEGTTSSGQLREIMPITCDIRGRKLLLLEDIVDTGTSMHYLKAKLRAEGAAELRLATLLYKPCSLRYPDAKPDYVGLEIPDDFIVGFGLDYDGLGRALRDIYVSC
jgi:hypoxanthine phosphoribosyltransferase